MTDVEARILLGQLCGAVERFLAETGNRSPKLKQLHASLARTRFEMKEAGSHRECQFCFVNQAGKLFQVFTEPNVPAHAKWIKGEGADICIHRAVDDDRIVGANLPLPHGLWD